MRSLRPVSFRSWREAPTGSQLCLWIDDWDLHNIDFHSDIKSLSEEVNANVELCRITRQKYAQERSLYAVNGHFERIFNAVGG